MEDWVLGGCWTSVLRGSLLTLAPMWCVKYLCTPQADMPWPSQPMGRCSPGEMGSMDNLGMATSSEWEGGPAVSGRGDQQ